MLRRCANVAQAAVRARADEHDVDGRAEHRFAGLDLHVCERFAERRIVVVRHGARRSAMTMPGFVPSVTIGRKLRDVDVTSVIELRAGVARQRAPAFARAASHVLALRRERPARHVLIRRVVGRDHAGARAGLDRHVADRHALFHRQRR